MTIETISTIPAAPGWFVVEFCEDDDTLVYEPIIAWEIERTRDRRIGTVHHDVTPLTLEGNCLGVSVFTYAIKRPDGTFETMRGPTFKNEADMIAEFKRLLRLKETAPDEAA